MSNRYQDIKKTKSFQRVSNYYGTRYFVNNIYPDIPFSENDQYVIVTIGDRLDLLAYDSYKDESLWWIIAVANNLPGDSLIPEPGLQLRIPVDIQNIMNIYKHVNTIR